MFSPADAPPPLALTVYGASVAAGFPSPADDYIEGKLDLNEHLVHHPAATFFVRATGASMRDVGIFDGDLMIIDRSLTAQPGDIVIAAVHGDLTVKRLLKRGGRWLLAPENPNFAALTIDDPNCEIWGVVTHSIRRHCGR